MKKRIISTLMAAMVSLSLLACGSDKAGESETIPNITKVETTSTAAETEEISTSVEAENTSTPQKQKPDRMKQPLKTKAPKPQK